MNAGHGYNIIVGKWTTIQNSHSKWSFRSNTKMSIENLIMFFHVNFKYTVVLLLMLTQ